jgi:hypothetical protein
MMSLQHSGADHRQAVQPHLWSEHHDKRGKGFSTPGTVSLGECVREQVRPG